MHERSNSSLFVVWLGLSLCPSVVLVHVLLQRWAFAADALEELCPGACDQAHWNASAQPSVVAKGYRGSSRGDASGGDGAEENVGSPSVTAGADAPPGSVATPRSTVNVVSVGPTVAIVAPEHRKLPDPSMETEDSGVEVAVGLTMECPEVGKPGGVVEAQQQQQQGGEQPAHVVATLPPKAEDSNSPVASSEQSGVTIPFAAGIPMASTVQCRAPPQNERLPSLPPPLLPASPSSILQVVAALQDFRMSLNNTLSQHLFHERGRVIAVGMGLGRRQGSHPLDYDVHQGALHRGKKAGGTSSQVSAGLSDMLAEASDFAPPENLLDPLLHQVVRILGVE